MAHGKLRAIIAIAGFLGGLATYPIALATPVATPAASPAPPSAASAGNGTLPELPNTKSLPAAAGVNPPATPLSQPSPANPAPANIPAAPAASAPPGAPAAAITSSSAPPAIAHAPFPAPPPAPAVSPATTYAAAKAAQEVVSKNPGLLLEPMHLGNTSLIFNKQEMDVILEAFSAYDSTTQKEEVPSSHKDDLTWLLDSIKSRNNENNASEVPPPLPHLYLGSIVYYSPSHWSVWINGKKLINKNNAPTNEFYVSRLSRSEIELIWKPASLQETGALWQQMTGNGAHTLPHVSVDTTKGTITLELKPNQTFLPRSLAIREGLIKPSPDIASSAQDTAHMPPDSQQRPGLNAAVNRNP